MTEQEQDAVIGRLVREKRDAEGRRAAIEAEAYRISETLSTFAGAAKKNLSGIHRERESINVMFLSFGSVTIPETEFGSVEKVLTLASEYRAVLERLKTISEQLSRAGFSN